jgi:hypothetical protein
VSSIRPPSTRIWPSSTTTVPSIERLVVDGPALLVPAAVVALDAALLLVDRHADRAAFADLRLDAQRDAHVLALDGLERVGGARCRCW